MNQVEQLQGEIASLSYRVRKLEVLFASRAALNNDERAAQQVAQEIGFSPDIIFLTANRHDGGARQRPAKACVVRLARELVTRGWTKARIARALRCSERTVTRWLA